MQRIVNRGQTATTIMLPPPVGGMNTRDELAGMDPRYAVAMRDLFPSGTHVELRPGDSVAQTMTGMNSSSAFPGFIRYGDTSMWMAVYDQGASEMELKSLTGATQTITGHAVAYAPLYTQFANSAGNFVAVIFRNGDATNNYFTYDGTTWTARTAATTNSQYFNFVIAFKGRLWFLSDVPGKELTAYYLPTSAITGTTVEFPLGGVASKGGKLYAMGAWTRDGGEGGADDFLVFTTTAGQVIVYQGTDPSVSATWGIVGVFDISRPVGKPFKYGSDLLLPTEDGLYSANAILNGQSGPEFAISDIVRPTWQALASAAINSYGAATALERVSIAYAPRLNHLMVMFRDQSLNGSIQNARNVLAMNTITKAWTLYLGIDGYNVDSFRGDIFHGNIVFEGGGYTAKAYKFGGSSVNPETGSLTGFCIGAYTSLLAPGRFKQVTAVRPTVAVTGTMNEGRVTGAVDFQYRSVTELGFLQLSDAIANVSDTTVSRVLSLPMSGNDVSLGGYFKILDSAATVKWFATEVLVAPGGFV